MQKNFIPSQNLGRKSLLCALVICGLCVSLLPALGLAWKLHYFLPALIICLYQRSLAYCLWLAIVCGLYMDLLGGNGRLGTYPLAYSITVLLLSQFRSYFFADRISTLPLLTAIGSVCATFVIACVLYLTDKISIFSTKAVIFDLGVMGCADALFATMLFVLPSLLLGKRQRKASDYFH